MDTIDMQKVSAVWHRVQGGSMSSPPPAVPDTHVLSALLTEEWQDAAIYRALSRYFRGKDSALLRRMAEQERAHAACLAGIYKRITGTRPRFRIPPVPRESAELLLRGCYDRELRCLAQYRQRSTDPEYGHVFLRLTQQEQEHCRQILELLGNRK